MADIFISYKSERRKAAEHLATVLSQYGYSVWFDYQLIKGSDFGLQIDRRIREAKALVVLWCSMSVGSRWVIEEVDLAHKLGILIPVKIEPCELPVGFRRHDYIDLSSWDGAPRNPLLDSLIDALEQRIGRPPQLDLKGVRQYESAWRRFGAPSLKAFALGTPLANVEGDRHMPQAGVGPAAPVMIDRWPSEQPLRASVPRHSADAQQIEPFERSFTEPFGGDEARPLRASRQEERRSKRVFLITSAFMDAWQVELEFYLLRSLTRKGLFCTVLVPPEHFKWDDHLDLHEMVLNVKDDYLGGFVIISTWDPAKTNVFEDFAVRFAKPIVFIDQNPAQAIKSIASNVSYVGISDESGGRLAAQAVLELDLHSQATLRALVISGAAKYSRCDVFANILRENNWAVSISQEGEFDREKSTAVAYNRLSAALKEQRPFDVVFCTNDSMTLGCLDAIQQIDNWPNGGQPKIIGYDGIAITKRLAEHGRIARTVVQSAREVARASIEQLLLMHEKKPSKRIVLLEPELFPRT
jgi:DNA-binding LacI/PurR family transcriptional regulator